METKVEVEVKKLCVSTKFFSAKYSRLQILTNENANTLSEVFISKKSLSSDPRDLVVL